jgi:hypothetical protein
VAADSAGLKVIDITNPTSPFEVGAYDTPGRARHVVISDHYAYIADQDSGMMVIDISIPSNPFEVGRIVTGGSALGIDIAGDIVYLADLSNGLRVIDVSDKANPTEIGSYTPTNDAYGVTIEGSYAYVSDGINGFRVLDISTPETPAQVGELNRSSFAHECVISGIYAYSAENYGGLSVVDISDPFNPSEVESYLKWVQMRKAKVVGDYAFVAADRNMMRSIDISDANSPAIVGEMDYGTTTTYGIDVAGDYVYVGRNNGISIINISSPTNPTYGEFFQTIPSGEVWGMEISGNLIYTAIGSFGLRILEMLTPTDLAHLGVANTIGPAYDIALSGHYAYLLDGAPGLGLKVVDVTDSIFPIQVGSYNTSGVARAIALDGNYAYIADYGSGLKIIDISIPSAPVKVGEFTSPDIEAAIDVAVTSFDFVYVADEVGGVRVIDVSTPALPQEVGYYQRNWQPSGVEAVDDLIFLSDWYNGLFVLENLLHPTSVREVTPLSFMLYQNYPNPFNPSTVIRYDVANPGNVDIKVYDVSGALIKILESRYRTPGQHEVQWDGSNSSGVNVSTGVYFYRLTTNGFSQTRKMILLK